MHFTILQVYVLCLIIAAHLIQNAVKANVLVTCAALRLCVAAMESYAIGAFSV